jgi:hypothetical protein
MQMEFDSSSKYCFRYTITYQLCEAGADPVNCTNATATVVVLNPIDAVDDNPVAVNTGVNQK